MILTVQDTMQRANVHVEKHDYYFDAPDDEIGYVHPLLSRVQIKTSAK